MTGKNRKAKKDSVESATAPLTIHPLVDTHCHLDMEQFDEDRDEVLRRAADANVEAVITVASDVESNESVLEIARKYAEVHAAVGLHPHDSKDFDASFLERLRQWSTDPGVVAIGETGLDYHYDHSPRQVQRKVFEKHLETAVETGLPAIIHSREAKEDTLSILKDSGLRRGVLHCFSGDADMAEKVIMMGFHISIAGPVTFKKADSLREVVKIIPDDHLLVETDAPYLTPAPYRGRRNEPSFVLYTASAIADARGVTPEDIARITTINARRLFRTGQVPSRGEIAYKIRDSLYLNITNRCTNRCTFCVRNRKDFVKGHNLRLVREPSAGELKKAIGDPKAYREIVFCGYGEPLLRLDLVKEVASWVKHRGGRVRINTNGHGNMIHRRNIVPELKGMVDSMSISLDADNAETYERLCLPVFEKSYEGLIEFIREAVRHIPSVQLTVVDTGDVDTERCRQIAEQLGAGFRIRKLDIVG